MFIWRIEDTSKQALQALLQTTTNHAECLVDDEDQKAIIISENGCPPSNVTQISSRRVHQAGDCSTAAGPWIFLVGIWAPMRFGEELCDWYQQEHIPILMECDDWKGVDLREALVSTGRQFYVLHRLACKSALDSPQRIASRSTPWFNRLAENSWFDGPFERTLYKRVFYDSKETTQ